MSDEHVDILDNMGRPTGEIRLKSEAHTLGLYHVSVHIWFYTDDGKILFQRRSNKKDTFPGLWDISVAGHVSAGETSIQGAIREIEEEIGLTIDEEELEYIGRYRAEKKPKPKFYDNEFHDIYLVKFIYDINTLKLQKEEVSGLGLIDINHAKFTILNDPDKLKYFVPHNKDYYQMIFEKIKSRL